MFSLLSATTCFGHSFDHRQVKKRLYNIFIFRTCIFLPIGSQNIYFLNNKIDALISQIYFVMKLYMLQIILLSIISSLFTVHSAMVYVIQFSSRTRMELLESCLQICMQYTIAECAVNKFLMMDRGTVRNM